MSRLFGHSFTAFVPTRAGDIVLPPVSIASFDPALARYVTHVTAGVPIRVVAVPSFDPTTIPDDSLSAAAGRPSRTHLGCGFSGDCFACYVARLSARRASVRTADVANARASCRSYGDAAIVRPWSSATVRRASTACSVVCETVWTI